MDADGGRMGGGTGVRVGAWARMWMAWGGGASNGGRRTVAPERMTRLVGWVWGVGRGGKGGGDDVGTDADDWLMSYSLPLLRPSLTRVRSPLLCMIIVATSLEPVIQG